MQDVKRADDNTSGIGTIVNFFLLLPGVQIKQVSRAILIARIINGDHSPQSVASECYQRRCRTPSNTRRNLP